MRIGAYYAENGKCDFIVWAPFLKTVALKIVSPHEKIFPMEKDTKGYWKTTVENVSIPTLYIYMLEDERERISHLLK
jgi:maltooligosyltrehalose trehalohydrolase